MPPALLTDLALLPLVLALGQFGPRYHLKWGKRWVRPGLSYTQALDRPLDTPRYRMLQIDVPVVL